MNKKEISEIRKLFAKDSCRIDSLAACYVSIEKEKTFVINEALSSLSEEELQYHLSIFHKCLGGTLGKNLINMEFPLDAEFGEGQQKFLLNLRDSGLKEEEILEKFFDLIIANYPSSDKYYIVAIHGNYDVPGKGKDGAVLEDASEIVYEYILCAICPVKLSKAALGYDSDANRIRERVRDWVVEAPEKAFLFPAFNDRGPDIHSMLYYTKKAEELFPEFVETVFGTTSPLSPETQTETFNSLITETLGDEVSLEIVQRVQENIAEVIEQNKEIPEPVELTPYEMKELLGRSGVEDEKLENFEKTFKEVAGEKGTIIADNLPVVKQLKIKAPDIEIKVKPESASLISHKMVDGVLSIVIPVGEGVEVNGIAVKHIENQE
ncbi:hypothetical protein GCWU000282_00904 [Catonella morbi ATCC 51271]|uniref:DUF4317 domain-containing protein n=1 Tax=Catonella morbi ATCC 51271 TaxID=592026 RepID=V2XNK2_9FIRM|nr:DUF4317 domain-containing protein [Catonella morbi]ESL03739.1 hypothetical protein GCWU000282_00904 [Catonella morbi ATCC 51271]